MEVVTQTNATIYALFFFMVLHVISNTREGLDWKKKPPTSAFSSYVRHTRIYSINFLKQPLLNCIKEPTN